MESHTSAWHDRQVARAADAWLACPGDTTAYARLVQAVTDRRAVLNPRLPGLADETLVVEPVAGEPDILDAVGADHPPQSLSDIIGDDGAGARVVLDRLCGHT